MTASNDILIIGGGVIGLSIARELHRRGVGNITVLEKNRCGEEASWAAAGMLSPQVEADANDAFLEFCCKSRDMYPQFAEELLGETGIDIELDRTGTLSVAFQDEEAIALTRRFEFQKAAGLAVEQLEPTDIARLEPHLSGSVTAALFFPNDWQVENRKLVAALRKYAEQNDIEIREDVEVNSLITDGTRVIGVNDLRAGVTILATGAWTSFIKIGMNEMPLAVEPIRGQIVCYKPAEKPIKHVVWGPSGYLVPRRDGRILAGSTSERVGFEKSVTGAAKNALTAMAEELVPNLSATDIAEHWSGLRPHASDDLPVIGTIDGLDGLVIATAHYRNGILLAPATANAVGDALTTVDSLKEFSPNRFTVRGFGRGV